MNKRTYRRQLQNYCDRINASKEINDLVERANIELRDAGADCYVTAKCIIIEAKHGKDIVVLRVEKRCSTYTELTDQIMTPNL